MHGGYHFQQTGGNDVQLWGNDVELSGSVNDATFVKLSSGTVSATWQCADSQGFAYCLDSSRDTAVKTDGSAANTTFQTGIPLGTMLTFTPTQLVVAGVNANENTIYISQQNAFTTFTVGTLPSSAFTEPIASPGSRITHLAYYFGKLFWWKDQSFGYATFTSQFDWQLTIVSNQVGTLDNSDAFWNASGFDSGAKFTGTAQANANQSPGGIFFRGQDNHLYVYDGYYLTRLSRSITPSITAASRRKANSWTQTTQADFQSGISTPTANLGYPSNGTIILSSGVMNSSTTANYPVPVMVDSQTITNYSFESPPLGAAPGWSSISVTGSLGSTDCGTITPQDGSEFAYISNGSGGGNITIEFIDAVTSATLASIVNFGSAITCSWTLSDMPSVPAGRYGRLRIKGAGTFTTLYSDAFVSNGIDITFYWTHSLSGTTNSWTFDNFGAKAKVTQYSYYTGIYYSPVHNAPNLSSWGTFSLSDSVPGASSLTYFTRSSTNSFTTLSSTPTWVAQTKNIQVATSTGTYFQMSSTFSITAATEAPTINDFTFNWFEGSASDKAYMTYFNDAIWFSVSSSTSVSINNRVFYWDILNGAWLIYDIAANGFQIENNRLYFGDPSTGKVYLFGNVTTDNAAAINSYWRSKSFLGQDPFIQNEFVQADFILSESSTSLTYTYTLDSKTSTAYTMTAYDSVASLIQRNFLLPVGKIGKYYDFKISDNSSNAAWRLMAHKVHYNPLNWKPVLQ